MDGVAMTAFNERHSDAGNAIWMRRLYGDELRYVRERGKWLVTKGPHWREDADGEVERMAKQAVASMLSSLDELPRDQRDAIWKHVLRSEQAPRLAAMVSLLRSEISITIGEDALDRDPMLLGVPGGAVDLRNGQWKAPRAADYVTRVTGCDYNPHAMCPTWRSFLERVTGGNVDLAEFLKRAIGYTLTGDTREQVLFILHGNGANGKTVLLRAIRQMFGSYGADAAMASFADRRNDAASNDLARLAGARFVCASEPTRVGGSPRG